MIKEHLTSNSNYTSVGKTKSIQFNLPKKIHLNPCLICLIRVLNKYPKIELRVTSGIDNPKDVSSASG